MDRDRKIVFDDDNPEWTEADFARAKAAGDMLPPEAIAAFGKPRGRPKLRDAKEVVTLRLRPSLLDAYRARGADWRAQMEAVLIEAIAERSASRGQVGPSRAASGSRPKKR